MAVLLCMYVYNDNKTCKLTDSSWFIIGISLNCENIPPVYCSSLLVASIPQLTGPRAKISAFILSAPRTLPNSLTP